MKPTTLRPASAGLPGGLTAAIHQGTGANQITITQTPDVPGACHRSGDARLPGSNRRSQPRRPNPQSSAQWPGHVPDTIPDGLGVVQHSFANTFAVTIPSAWVKMGLQVAVNAGPARVNFTDMKVGAPTNILMK